MIAQLLSLSVAVLVLVPAPRALGAAAKVSEREAFFAATNAHTFVIQIPPEDYKKLQKDNRAYVKCDVTVDGAFLAKDCGVHLKGGAGSFRGLNDKPALTLSFGKFQEGQRLAGIHKLHLNNSVQDPGYMTENLCGWLFDKAGVPAPKVTWGRVKLNGRDLGFFVVKEGYAKDFIHRYFKDATGNFYDGGFCQDIDAKKQKTAGENPDDQGDLKELALAARETDPAKRWEALSKRLDVERFAAFTVLEVFTAHWDGYTHNRNNYRMYHDPTTDKLVFIPSGMDQMFGGGQHARRPGGLNGMVTAAFMQTPQGRALYEQQAQKLFTSVFQLEDLLAHVNEISAVIQSGLTAISPNVAREHQGQVASLRDRITGRHRDIARQLGEPPPEPIKFAADGTTQIKRWEAKQDSGEPQQDQPKVDGRATYHILAKSGGTVASWRAPVTLPPGKYRFTARAKCAGIQPISDPPGIGAGLRISGGQRTNKLVGSSGWTTLEHVIEIADTDEIVLVAELRASKGEVWFDTESFKIARAKN
ncbi:hypothetical protein LBMAG56_04610 [Verrucomicrobiota bacterium]|nr:hypothetical protein LBMAG56_04610 [Verrucomicrobiota bacterium]